MKTIFTAKVNCRDCHRCVRICPVKAIGIEDGHAKLVDESCIFCGKCVLECPRNAKQIIDWTEKFYQAKSSGKQIVLSLAPSFIAAFPDYSYNQLVQILLRAGFDVVQETAIGAEVVSFAYKSELETTDKPLISACCPVVVNLIEKYYPELVPNISQVRSPMLVHASLLREKYGREAFIVFAGPCLGKFEEAALYPEDINLVLTFTQLQAIIKSIDISDITAQTALDEREAYANARYFPIRGGIIKSFMASEETDIDIFSVSGISDCMEVFDNLVNGEIKPRFIEAMACRGGCISGPGMLAGRCQPVKRINVIKFATLSYVKFEDYSKLLPRMKRTFTPKKLTSPQPSEAQIREILQKIGKYSVSDEKNCGACGYDTCRQKAIATFQGLAEPNMCIPFMRSKAESLSNLIVDSSTDAIVVVDSNLIVQEFSPMAEVFFEIPKTAMVGLSLTGILDCSDIREAFSQNSKKEIYGKSYRDYNMVFDVRIMPITEQNLMIVIFKDVTELDRQKRELMNMKISTIDKATSIINKQMQVAQEIAGLLGETTAETKSALLELITVINAKGEK